MSPHSVRHGQMGVELALYVLVFQASVTYPSSCRQIQRIISAAQKAMNACSVEACSVGGSSAPQPDPPPHLPVADVTTAYIRSVEGSRKGTLSSSSSWCSVGLWWQRQNLALLPSSIRQGASRAAAEGGGNDMEVGCRTLLILPAGSLGGTAEGSLKAPDICPHCALTIDP